MTEAQAVYGLAIGMTFALVLAVLAAVSGTTAFEIAERHNFNDLPMRAKMHLWICGISTTVVFALLVFGWVCVGAKWK